MNHRPVTQELIQTTGSDLLLDTNIQNTQRDCWMLKLSVSLFPQGVTCILPVLREGVLTGSPEQKEEAAKALGGVIKLTSPEALRPSVINITGPLIRILGDRFAWTVKTALLETLTLLLAKVCTCTSTTPDELVLPPSGGSATTRRSNHGPVFPPPGGHRPEALPASAADHLPEGPAGLKSCREAQGCRGSGPTGFHPHQGGPTLQ